MTVYSIAYAVGTMHPNQNESGRSLWRYHGGCKRLVVPYGDAAACRYVGVWLILLLCIQNVHLFLYQHYRLPVLARL